MSKDMDLVRVEFYLPKRAIDLLRILAKQEYRTVNDQMWVMMRKALNEADIKIGPISFGPYRNFKDLLEECLPFVSGDYGKASLETNPDGEIESRVVFDEQGKAKREFRL